MDKFLLMISITCILSVQLAYGLRCYNCLSTNHNCEGTLHYDTCPSKANACYVARSRYHQEYMENRSCGTTQLCNPNNNISQIISDGLSADGYDVVAVCDTDLCNGGIEDNCNGGNGV